MRDRLQKFMDLEKLSASRLAEILGVQPATISHILSGRNKPSFEFIERMLLRFPKLCPEWFILGKGPTYRMDGMGEASAPTATQRAIFDAPILENNTQPIAGQDRSVEKDTPVTATVSGVPDRSVSSDSFLTSTESLPDSDRLNALRMESGAGVSPVDREGNNASTKSYVRGGSLSHDGNNMLNNSDLCADSATRTRLIERIVLFYSDGTFHSFKPDC